MFEAVNLLRIKCGFGFLNFTYYCVLQELVECRVVVEHLMSLFKEAFDFWCNPRGVRGMHSS